MRPDKNRTNKVCLMTMTAGILCLLGGGAVLAKTYHLSVSGDEGARFSGTCTIGNGDSETALELNGEVPHQQDLVGDRLSCRLETNGKVVVDIDHGGSRTRSATSGGTINVSLR